MNSTEYSRPDLTNFQHNLLTVIAGGGQKGLQVKGELEDYYEEEINHGRLYPNLDDLADEGYIEKLEGEDDRSNLYVLRNEGRKAILEQRRWEDQFLHQDEELHESLLE